MRSKLLLYLNMTDGTTKLVAAVTRKTDQGWQGGVRFGIEPPVWYEVYFDKPGAVFLFMATKVFVDVRGGDLVIEVRL